MSESRKIALVRINPVTGDLDGNTDKICDAMLMARRQGCDMAVFPETAVTGQMSCHLLQIDDFVSTNIRKQRVCLRFSRNHLHQDLSASLR